jgi:hypothetical protein
VVAHLFMEKQKTALELADEMVAENLRRYNIKSREYHLTGRKTGYQADHLRLDARLLVILMEQYYDAVKVAARIRKAHARAQGFTA